MSRSTIAGGHLGQEESSGSFCSSSSPGSRYRRGEASTQKSFRTKWTQTTQASIRRLRLKTIRIRLPIRSKRSYISRTNKETTSLQKQRKWLLSCCLERRKSSSCIWLYQVTYKARSALTHIHRAGRWCRPDCQRGIQRHRYRTRPSNIQLGYLRAFS